MRAVSHASRSASTWSAGRSAPLFFNTTWAIGDSAYMSTAASNAAAVLIVDAPEVSQPLLPSP